MPPKETQKQKQKQTVIVNIGDKVVKKKRKRKPRKKAAPRGPPRGPSPPPPGLRGPPPPPPPPFAPQDFARVIFQPQPPLRPDENLAVQLNSVTKQLNELQEKQKNRTGNLMAGQRAVEREAEQQMATEEEKPPPKQRKKKLVIKETSPPPVVEAWAGAAAEPDPAASLSPEPAAAAAAAEEPRKRGRPRGRKASKERSDKGVPRPLSRGQSFERVAHNTLARGGRLATILPTPPAPEGEELGTADSEQGGMVFA